MSLPLTGEDGARIETAVTVQDIRSPPRRQIASTPHPFAATGRARLEAGAPKIGARGSFHGPPQTPSRFFSPQFFPPKLCSQAMAFNRAGRSGVRPGQWGADCLFGPGLLRLLPAGAFAGRGLHPLESAAFSRRTRIADVADRGRESRKCEGERS